MFGRRKRDESHLRKMPLDELITYTGGWKPGTPEHIKGKLEIERRTQSPIDRRTWIAIWIAVGSFVVALISLIVSLVT